jgi:two-component system sensor histidine kinase UhpB
VTAVNRHAGARHVRMKLTSGGGDIRLSIEDDGCGLSAAPTASRGLGVIGMRARARSAGGDVNVRSSPGEGVLIEVRVPLDHLPDETHSHPVG